MDEVFWMTDFLRNIILEMKHFIHTQNRVILFVYIGGIKKKWNQTSFKFI
jgi:hypothetical protein